MVFGRRYRVTEKIGAGGMADVFKAVDEVLGRTVAVKVMHPRYAADPTFAARFRQEAQAAANLQNPYIVNIYDWGQDGETYYIVMEYVRGTDLKTLIQQRGNLDSRRVAEIGSQVCSALSVAHGYDVIHRDIKPHNIMVTPEGSVKVMDFGIARAGNTTMTQTGSVLGTAHYVSPEQAQGRPLTAASDLYSLGVVLYEAATGRLPFDAETPVAVALKQVNEQPVPPSRINPAIDRNLERVILKALAKQTSERYATADEMRRDLNAVAQGRDVTAAIPVAGAAAGAAMASETAVMPAVGGSSAPQIRPVPERRNRTWLWVLLAVALIAVGLGLAYFLGLLGPQGKQVPNVVGMSVTEAEATLTEAGFVLGDVNAVFNADVPTGQVIDQSPVAMATAEKGSAVNVTTSKGPKLVEVPTLIGLSEADAQAKLKDLGFTASPLPDQYNAEIDPGVVFKQEPQPGEKLAEGSPVQYVISLGKKTAEVPDVRGKSRADAEATLRNAGFKVAVSQDWSESVAAGIVMSQNPGAGLNVVEGSPVTIVVSKGPERVAVPDTIGSTMAEGKAALEAEGFKVQVLYEPHAENGAIIDQDPRAGTMAKRGSTVKILVDAAAP